MYKVVKRALDIFFSAFFLIVLSPFFLLAALLIWLFMGRPIVYTQTRIGRYNKPFLAYKFRSMKDKTSKNQTDADRITWIGRLLRVSRIDEFPQLYNILKGDMSFIGPRPLLPEYLPYYTKQELKRHEVRPGLSGLSQVSGSYPAWEKQFEYDLEYVNKLSFSLDIRLFFKTILKVLRPSRKLVSGKTNRQRFDEYRKKD